MPTTSVLRRAGAALAALALLATGGGCSSRTAVGRATGDFTAYYNALYNARKSYAQGTEALRTARVPVSRDAYLAVYPPTVGGNSAAFDGTIRKAADVLRKHPGSRWTDDALLLIGQSYYHLAQYPAAEQKFRELLFEWRGRDGRTTPRADEARLWLARTLVANQRWQAATDFFAESLSPDADLSRGTTARLLLARADLHVARGAFGAAADDLRAALPDVGDRGLRARGAFLLGQVEETRGAFAAARDAFDQAARLDAPDELTLAARVGALRMQAAAGDVDGAVRGLASLSADERNADVRADLSSARARVLARAGRRDEARDLIVRTLRGQDRDLAARKGVLYYTLADLYRTGYGDYLTAALYYDSAGAVLPAASTVAPRGSLSLLPAPEAVRDVAARREVFTAFAAARRRTLDADSLLRLGALSDDEFATFVRGLREQRAREQEAAARSAARADEARAFGGVRDPNAAAVGVGRPGEDAPVPGGSDAGFLQHRDPARVRANRLAFERVWGDRPLAPHWRRRAALRGAPGSPVRDEPLRGTDLARAAAEDRLPVVDVSAIPRSALDQARVRADRAEARYALANAFLLRLDLPDSARVWLRRIVDEDAGTPIAPRALYALAEAEAAAGDTAVARTLFERVLAEHPTLDVVPRVRERLGLAPLTAVSDSAALAAEAYTAALAQPGLDPLLDVAARFPRRREAAQALLAAARRTLEQAAGDTLALARPLVADSTLLLRAGLRPDTAGAPLTVVHLLRAVVELHPGTPHATAASATLDALAALWPRPAAGPDGEAPGRPAPTGGQRP